MIENRDALARSSRYALALDCLEAGIEAAHPRRVVAERIGLAGDRLRVAGREIDLGDVDRLLVVGGGNAAGTAAAALESALGEAIDDGVVVTDEPADCDRVRVRAGDHPVPSERNTAATEELLDLARSADAADLVLAVVTGGGSALMTAPAAEIGVSELRSTTDALLESGAAIDEINSVRKHLSALKGGRLARLAAPATTVGLVFSDVVRDDPATVASGPTAPDRTTYGDAVATLHRHGVAVPDTVRAHLEAGARGEHAETPTADDPAVAAADNRVLATGVTSLEAAADRARAAGYTPLVLSSRIRGEARAAATTHVAVAEECAASGNPVEPPAVLLSGGETTVRRSGRRADGDGTGDADGIGGPNHEFGLSAALDLGDAVLASVDTDGIDGSAPTAGALVDGDTVTDRDGALAALRAHDSYPFLRERGGTVRTGATGTNVNDLRVVVVD